MTVYDLLNKYQMTVTTAESCTGGLVASGLVDIAGISAFFKEGYVTYAPEAKERILGVPKEVIEQYGVVSEETAAKIARAQQELQMPILQLLRQELRARTEEQNGHRLEPSALVVLLKTGHTLCAGILKEIVHR